MLQKRIIPFLSISEGKLVKTVRFKNPTYIGDPINAVRIFNDKEVDEIVLLDIGASKKNQSPNFDLIEKIASEAFVPLAYGGGVTEFSHFERLYQLGIEKVVVNSVVTKQPSLIEKAIDTFGSQSVVLSIDVSRDIFSRRRIVINGGTEKLKYTLNEYLKHIERFEFGEIVLGTVYNDGIMQGYDLELIKEVSNTLTQPLIVVGGAGSLSDIGSALKTGADAAGIGSLCIYKGKQKGILINYPSRKEIEALFNR